MTEPDQARPKEAEGCKRCDLYRNATQTVFGDGAPTASHDAGRRTAGRPGGQGRRAVRRSGGSSCSTRHSPPRTSIASAVYLTNAVKHFKFDAQRGKRRIHKTPSRTEVVACQPWLLAEINTVRPDVVVLLGATAAKSLLGSSFRLTAAPRRGASATCRRHDSRTWTWTRRWWPPRIRRRCCAARPRTASTAFKALVSDLQVRGRAPCTREMIGRDREVPTDHVARLQDGRIIGLRAVRRSATDFRSSTRTADWPAALTSRRQHRSRTRPGYDCISPDRPGIGLSDPLPGRTILDWAHDIGELARPDRRRPVRRHGLVDGRAISCGGWLRARISRDPGRDDCRRAAAHGSGSLRGTADDGLGLYPDVATCSVVGASVLRCDEVCSAARARLVWPHRGARTRVIGRRGHS